jgi:GNAT superfamily N-acetyltransferase
VALSDRIGGTMEIVGYTVEPLTPQRFDDLVTVLGRGGVGGCWCMYWRTPTTTIWRDDAKGGSTAVNRSAFADIVEEGPPPGLLAYEDGNPVAWCRVVERRSLPGLANSRFFRTDLDIDGVWSLACFVVRASHRGMGLTEVLVKAAIQYVGERGGKFLEAYPWDTDEVKSAMTVYTGLASTFERLGFEVVQRKAPHKPMMRFPIDA